MFDRFLQIQIQTIICTKDEVCRSARGGASPHRSGRVPPAILHCLRRSAVGLWQNRINATDFREPFRLLSMLFSQAEVRLSRPQVRAAYCMGGDGAPLTERTRRTTVGHMASSAKTSRCPTDKNLRTLVLDFRKRRFDTSLSIGWC